MSGMCDTGDRYEDKDTEEKKKDEGE